MNITDDEYRKLVSMARRMCAAYRLPCEPEDLAGDTVVVCADKAEQFDPERGAKLQWMKARMRKIALGMPRHMTRNADDRDTAPPPFERDLDALEALDSVLTTLTQRDRDVLMCRCVEELTVPQTAQRLGLTKDQVRATKRRLDRLRVQWGEPQ